MLSLFVTLTPALAVAQVPTGQIPASVLAEVRALEARFDEALIQDCSTERCFSKGCTYSDHMVIDQPKPAALPGLGESVGPGGGGPVQEYLTRARCEFAYEKDAVASEDLASLTRRLRRKLSKGWLSVSIRTSALDPISPGLQKAQQNEEPELEEPTVIAPTPEVWSPRRELWASLLPHFWWMIGLPLLTLMTLIVIWALRRLGRESLEEKLLLKELDAPTEPKVSPEPTEPKPVDEERKKWAKRFSPSGANVDESVDGMLREWLRSRDYPMLAKAVFVFSENLPEAFPSDGDLASHKLEFADFIRKVDESELPSDEAFFAALNQHAAASSLLSHPDSEIYRRLRDEFGPSGVVELLAELPTRYGAHAFVLAPAEVRREASVLLDPPSRVRIARQLMTSNRLSRDESAYLLEALRAAEDGDTIPSPPVDSGIADRGIEIDAASALSELLPHVPGELRVELFNEMAERWDGQFPRWYEGIVYPDLLNAVPQELRGDLLLEVDVRALAAWCSLQPPEWLETFSSTLPATLRGALSSGTRFDSRAEQMALAAAGSRELSRALQSFIARGAFRFSDVVA